MKHLRFILLPLLLTVACFGIGYVFDHNFWKPLDEEPNIGFSPKNIEQILHQKEKRTDQLIDSLKTTLKTQAFRELNNDTSANSLFALPVSKQLHHEGITLLVYKEDTLNYWTDNRVPVNPLYSQANLDSTAVALKNGLYVIRKTQLADIRIVGLILIKTIYQEENDYLKNTFHEDFNLDPSIDTFRLDPTNSFTIHNKEGKPAFVLTPTTLAISEKPYYYPTLLFYLASIACLIVFLVRLFRFLFAYKPTYWWYVAFIFLTAGIRYLMLEFRFPFGLYPPLLFDSEQFAESFWLASLGDFLITSILIFVFSYFFIRHIDVEIIKQAFKKRPPYQKFIFTFVSLLLTVLYFGLVHYLFKSLIINSNIPFELSKVLNLTIYTLVGVIIIGLQWAGFIPVLDKVVNISINLLKIKEYWITILILIAAIIPLNMLSKHALDLRAAIFLAIMLAAITSIRYKNIEYKYHVLALIVFLTTLFSIILITETSAKREREKIKVLITNLAVERQGDRVTEYEFMSDFTEKMNQDTLIQYYIQQFQKNQQQSKEYKQQLNEYLESNYLNRYFKHYGMTIKLCRSNDSIEQIVGNDTIYENCFNLFTNIQMTQGEPLMYSPNFFFIHKLNDKINYLGSFFYQIDSTEIGLFIELESRKVFEEGWGYPKLLLNKATQRPQLSQYSYAKYKHGKLVAKSGKFSYRSSRKAYGHESTGFHFVDDIGGYQHWIYNTEDGSTTIISRLSLQALDLFISFSYLLVFYYLALIIALFAVNHFTITLPNPRHLSLKSRIQFSLIAVLSLSLFSIGGGTIYYSVYQYRAKHNALISEKIQSVLKELEYEFNQEKQLTANSKSRHDKSLSEALMIFYDIFETDVHLYNVDGTFLASSRPEIFEKGLTGFKMNPEAYLQLQVKKKDKYIHHETIGDFRYLTAYAPFKNSDNQTLAYINLPYFSKQPDLTKEISDFVVAIVNVFALLLVFAIIITILVAKRITKPLQLIKDKFKEIELGKPNEYIMYERRDEIGGLIREYNRMVLELAHSADLLARSERESAWREMARQIAHEIKNPLTPMKLSIQFLERSWDMRDPDFEERLKKVLKTLAEQIDKLSSIASSFSNFAKIPKTNNEVINLAEVLKSDLMLFESTEEVLFTSNLHRYPNGVRVFADKEQMSRVFINLIKNALQAMKSNINGHIHIELVANNKRVITKVIDNGTGIPKPVQAKLFQPSFTTKSSGMGLGLSIVKTIVEENSNGKIWFETEINKGTTFFVELPAYQEKIEVEQEQQFTTLKPPNTPEDTKEQENDKHTK